MNKAIGLLSISILILLLASCNNSESLFDRLPATQTGIDFSNDLNPASRLNIFNYLYYYNGSGVAAADYNNDGLTDLYFTANEGPNKLYLNLGDFRFREITASANLSDSEGWTTGVSNIDVNNDGRMDIYICKLSAVEGMDAHNLLFVNQGNNSNGEPIFQEMAANYGLDFKGFSTQAALLDYDRDGDMDLYLLNHSLHPNRTYGRGNNREKPDARSGDRLFKNEGDKFVDVSSTAGIFQGITGYGLGIGVGDLNNDNFPDVYVGNDFFENDYLYLNNQDGSFSEIITEKPQNIGHTSHFSMGNDIQDINNDGLADIISLDMLPEDLQTYKTSGLEYPFQTYANYLRNGFSPQYMQNMLLLNQGNMVFSETAYLSGVAATEWSWSALIADFDNDSRKDLFITNGIKGATNDMDYIKFISNENIQKQLNAGEPANFEELSSELPEKKVENYIFRNEGGAEFKKMNGDWLPGESGFSHGAVYVDLDNDGDLDLVVNNMDEKAGIFRNNAQTRKNPARYLKIRFAGSSSNKFGIGSKATVYYNGNIQVQENYMSRGYLSSGAPILHFGMGNVKMVDSVKVTWSDGSQSLKTNIPTNTLVDFDHSESIKVREEEIPQTAAILDPVDSLLNFQHEDQSSLDFNRQVLVPFAYSNLSAQVASGDVNNDDLEDLVLGGGKKQASEVWLQAEEGGFRRMLDSGLEENDISEVSGMLLFDADCDGDLDLLSVSGGNEFKSGEPLRPKFYLNHHGKFKRDSQNFKDVEINASSVSVSDINKDGFPDVFISSNIIPGNFGRAGKSYLFLNDTTGHFTDVTNSFGKNDLGIVQDAAWADMNADGREDLILAGHWMPLEIYLNKEEGFIKLETDLEKFTGWWNVLRTADFDNDGDMDIISGNWGLNSRLKASPRSPVQLYLNDFDGNGTEEPIVSFYYKGKETVFASKDELDQQIPALKKKFTNYQSFAEAAFTQVFPEEKLNNSLKRNVAELASCYFENLGNGRFKKHILPFEAQVSSVFAIEVFDFNEDGFQDVLLAGNNYEISTQLGRLDASHGSLLLNDGHGNFKAVKIAADISGQVRDIEKVCINNEEHFAVSRNAGKILILKYNN